MPPWTPAGDSQVNDPIVEALTSCYRLIYPEMLLGVAACVLFLGGTVRANRHLWAAFSLLALAGAAALLAVGWNFSYSTADPPRAAVFNSPITNDSFAYLIKG